MANITSFDAPLDSVQPSDRAADTAREAGAVINRFGREAGEAIGRGISGFGPVLQSMADTAEAHQASAMIGHGSAVSTALFADMSQKWNQTAASADINNTSIGTGFKEKVLAPSLDNFVQQFEGAPEKVQEWAQRTADSMREHFTTRIAADEGIRAGVAVHQNIMDTVQNLSVAVANDPSALGDASKIIDMNADALIGSHVNLTAGESARLRGEIPKIKSRLADSAFDALAQKDPGAAKAALARGDFNSFWDGAKQAQAEKYADQQQKAQDADARRAALDAKQEKIQASADKADEYYSKQYDANSGRVLPPSPKMNQQIMNDPSLTQHDKNALIRWNQTQYRAQVSEDKAMAAGAPVRSDANVLADARARVGAVDNPLDKAEIIDLMGAEKISVKDAHDLSWRVGQTEAGWNAVQRQFKPQFENIKHAIMSDPVAKFDETTGTRLNQIEQDAQHKLRDLYQAHDKAGLQAALDPKSPQYVFANNTQRAPAVALKEGADKVRAAGKIIQKEFATQAEADAAGLKPGTRIKVNGVVGTWQ